MRFLAVFVFFLLTISCSKESFYINKKNIEGGSWLYADAKNFEFYIEDTATVYDIILNLEHSESFDYENFYVKIGTVFPTGEKTEDLVSLELTDELDQWEGKCSRSRCIVPIMLQERVYFKEKGNYRLIFEQSSRNDSLNGIYSLELSISNSTEDS